MKYKIGDRVKIKSLDWYNENKDEDGDVFCGEYDFVYPMTKLCGKIVTITCVNTKNYYYVINEDDGYHSWTDEMIEGLVESIEDRMKELRKMYTISLTNSNYTDKVEVLLNDYEYTEENGKAFFVKKKKECPKTYLKCCDILEIQDIISQGVNGYLRDKLETLQKLFICRDAYWKLYGEEIGLGKPWEPDYSGTFEHGTPIKYVIYNIGTHIVKERKSSPNHILSFPTEEMRDAFYENFKELIEICKEFL